MAISNEVGKQISELDDDEVRAAIKSLALNAIKELETIMRMGDLTIKLQVGKAILPHLVRAMNKDQENEEISVLKEKMAEMESAIKGTSTTRLRVVNHNIPEDTPN